MTSKDRARQSDLGSGDALDHANVVVMPPVLYMGSLLVATALTFLLPLSLEIPSLARWSVGSVLVIVGSLLAFGFVRSFRASGQEKSPRTPTPSIITTGVFRISRNPAYVGLTSTLVGIGILANSVWIVGAALPVVLIMHFGVILREEEYLQRRFGDEYLQYKSRVRRWL